MVANKPPAGKLSKIGFIPPLKKIEYIYNDRERVANPF